jgi:hypothetical protein
MARWLIFNADDYGLSPGVAAGIRMAAIRGVVRSTTVMANLATPEDVAALRGLPLSAGCHLNLSVGPPLSAGYPAALLDARGEFAKQRALNPQTWLAPTNTTAAVAEWRAQVARMKALGCPPSHLDSHHHTHLLPPLFLPALRLAQELGLPLRTRRRECAIARAAGVTTPDSLIESFFAADGADGADNLSVAALAGILATAPGTVVEVMCHPGEADQGLRARSGYVAARERELAVLTSPELRQRLEPEWKLSTYNI